MLTFQAPHSVVAIKAIAKKNLAKSQNLLGKEIKILKVRHILDIFNYFYVCWYLTNKYLLER